ncbi:hypothetical protein BYT27DRAFT_7123530 [Phlegmacium glaucopus]|nr:hypothetical protein BYT27DRAFT_7123530 [Phlegmacium glaucopus]
MSTNKSIPDSSSLTVPKVRDNRSNWSDYLPRIQRAMGSKGLWRHVEGTAVAPKLFMLLNGVPILEDGKTKANEEQIETKEIRMYMAQHIILSTTSTHLGAKIKNLTMVKEMWEIVKADATTKSTLYLLDAKDQIASTKLSDNDDPKIHLAELKQHFQLMLQCHDNLISMGSMLSNSRFNTIIMTSLPESYSHQKLGHISHSAIKHAISKGLRGILLE